MSTQDFSCAHGARSTSSDHTHTPRPSEQGRGMTPLGRPVDRARGAEGASAGLTRLLERGKALCSGLHQQGCGGLAAMGGALLCGPALASSCSLGEAAPG